MLIIGIVLLAVILLFFAATYLCFRIAFRSPNKKQNDFYNVPLGNGYDEQRSKMLEFINDLIKEPYEQVYVISFDGLKLCGRYYHFKDGAPLDIHFHGYRGTSVRDMCGGFKVSKKLGHNVLLVDQRAHGSSEGHVISFGVKERYDCVSWVEYAVERFGADIKIFLVGVSMGGTTVLMAAGLNLPKNVKAIIADAPFSSPEKIIKKVCKDIKFPPAIFYPLLAFGARIFGGFSLKETTATEAVEKSSLPILIIHGEADVFVPPSMSEEVGVNKGNVKRYTFANAGHGLSGMTDPERYDRILFEFANEVI